MMNFSSFLINVLGRDIAAGVAHQLCTDYRARPPLPDRTYDPPCYGSAEECGRYRGAHQVINGVATETKYLIAQRSDVLQEGRHEFHLLQSTFGKSGQIAPHGSLSCRACLRGHSAVISSRHVNSFSARPYLTISLASGYCPARPHLAHSIRS